MVEGGERSWEIAPARAEGIACVVEEGLLGHEVLGGQRDGSDLPQHARCHPTGGSECSGAGAIRSNQKQSEAIRSNQKQSEAVSVAGHRSLGWLEERHRLGTA